MDWQECIICQQRTTEIVKCPLNAVGTGDKSQPYKNFLNIVGEFRRLDRLPVTLFFDEATSAEDLTKHNASWHKSCYAKFNKCKLARAQKKRDSEVAEGLSEGVEGKRRRNRLSQTNKLCIFCTKSEGSLHEFMTLEADKNVRNMAADLQDTAVLARIAGGDVVAIDGMYHLSCLTEFRNRHRSLVRKRKKVDGGKVDEKKIDARAIIELINFIENSIEEGVLCFKVSELRHKYAERLVALGVQKEINKVRFKEKLLSYFPQAQVHNDGKHDVLMFDQGMKQLLKHAFTDYEGDAAILTKAANIIRNDILENDGFNFDGSFPPECQNISLPTTLKMFVSMLLNGTGINRQESNESQETLTISQLIVFNYKKTAKPGIQSRHSLPFEPPLPLYIGLNVHTLTRSRKLITQLHYLGISASYHRVLEVENQLATAVCQKTQEEGVVCPSKFRIGLFTVAAIDNIDHNPTSTTAKGSFHGTGISLFQTPSASNPGQTREAITLQAEADKKNLHLPDSYTVVPAVSLRVCTIEVPKTSMFKSVLGKIEDAVTTENLWIESTLQLIQKDKLEKGDSVAWSAYHAAHQTKPLFNEEPALVQLLPLFYEKASSVAMIKHGMNIARQSTQFLNPMQIPVVAMDAPLFALAKYIQWKWPNTHGEDKFVVMLGGLHIELAVWKTIGDYLHGSGWTNALTQAGLASSGTADSFLSCSHIKRTRHAHQVCAVVLKNLQREAFLASKSQDPEISEESWMFEMVKKSPTFQYWDTLFRLEILGLLLVRAHREADFGLYVETLKALAPWFFALDHHNYARWIPVHIRDMENLPTSILEEFVTHGLWVVRKTINKFSAMPIDQAHEQNNEAVKGSGGAVGLTENPFAFKKWMLAGPEQARLLSEFENCHSLGNTNNFHHEEGLTTQETFQRQVSSLTKTIREMGNPFANETEELLTLDSHDVLNQSVSTVRTIEEVGTQQYQDYCKLVLIDCVRSIHDPIKKNSFRLFKPSNSKISSREANKINNLKTDVSIFSRLYIVAQHRECDMNSFFSHENYPFPPSLSDNGKLHFGKKSDLIKCLVKAPENECHDESNTSALLANFEELVEGEPSGYVNPLDLAPELVSLEEIVQTDLPTSFDVKVFDGAAIVHFLSPTAGVTTFDDYAIDVFIPFVRHQLQSSLRVDIVWDKYAKDSLKNSVREKRGKGKRRKVTSDNKIPGQWQNFLGDAENKQELFTFLAKKIHSSEFAPGKVVLTTYGDSVLVTGSNLSLPACNHEEADTRMVFHLQHALQQGCVSCLVRTVDTDVIVILTGKFHQLQDLCPNTSIWVEFGTGRNISYVHINSIAQQLGIEKSTALPVFHSFTGCDTVSAFLGKGKKSGWLAWKAYPKVTEVFTNIFRNPFTPVDIQSDTFRVLERFTIICYQRTSQVESVNEARREMFCRQNKTMETLPPTQSALFQHTKRAVYQVGIWSTCDVPQQQLPTPEEWGWKMDRDSRSWIPLWTTQPVASKACGELVKCGCKAVSGCTNKCACKKAFWTCTELCKCNCIRN